MNVETCSINRRLKVLKVIEKRVILIHLEALLGIEPIIR